MKIAVDRALCMLFNGMHDLAEMLISTFISLEELLMISITRTLLLVAGWSGGRGFTFRTLSMSFPSHTWNSIMWGSVMAHRDRACSNAPLFSGNHAIPWRSHNLASMIGRKPNRPSCVHFMQAFLLDMEQKNGAAQVDSPAGLQTVAIWGIQWAHLPDNIPHACTQASNVSSRIPPPMTTRYGQAKEAESNCSS